MARKQLVKDFSLQEAAIAKKLKKRKSF